MVLKELLTICNGWVKGVGVIISRQGAKLAKVVWGLSESMSTALHTIIHAPLRAFAPLREIYARTPHLFASLRFLWFKQEHVEKHTQTPHSFAPLRALRENIHAHTLSLAIIITILTNNTQAQVYPVNGSAALIPPYSVYLSDYTSRTTDRLMLNVVLNDINRPELRVRLRLRIESQNIRIETKPEYIGSEIILQGGVPLQLKGIDLTEYFNANNLNFSGITRREFEKTGALPQGFYQFCFEVLEYNRGVKISNTICAPGWLILNDPPLVNLPRMDEKVIPTSPQNVVIQWTPRHTGSPNAAFSTEYEITMVEVWPATRNANDAILTSPPILEATTRSTTFIYGPAETPLELGRRYALRIKAKSIVGAEEYDLFKNNGYSEVVSFVYGDACVAPHNIQVETAATKFKVTWDGQLNHSAYTFRYRPAGSGSWYERNTNINEVNIYSLSPNTTYEYQVSGQCGLFDGQYTPIATIKTNDIGEAAYSCGLPIETFNLDPAELTGSLKVGDVIHAGDFKVKLTKVSGSNGVFSGEGVMEVSFFNKASVKAEFTNISVNKEQRMVSGFMNVTGAGVEVVPSGVMDLMDDLSETLTQFDSVLNDIEANIPQPFDPNSFVADSLVTISGEIHSVYKDTDGTIVIVDSKGTETRLPEGETYAIKDEKGKGYLVDAKGGVHETSAAVATKAGNREYNLIMKFGPDPLAHFGFDEQQHKALASYYEHIGEYDVPWKAVASGSTDPVMAHQPDASVDKTKIRFELFSQPAPAPPFNTEHSTSVTVTGKADGDIEDMIALYASDDATDKEQILGKVKVITYDKIKRHLFIVPVNNNTYPGSASQLTQDLNKIFGQAAVEWSVEVKPKIEVALNTTFDVGSSGLLSNYTTDMKTVINAYEDDMDDDSYYLFLVSKPSDAKLLGYMPRSKQAGFIFVDTNGSAARMTQTIAHELGHGAFNLEHTFSQFTALTKGSTNNLMDYAEGTMLHKYQWDNIHYPAIVIGLFESDEKAQSTLPCLGIFDDCDDVLEILRVIKAKVSANKNLVLFKPDESKSRKERYEGSYLSIGYEEYNKIEILNEIESDTQIDPKLYYDFSLKIDDTAYKSGFIYKLNDISQFKILVSDEGDSLNTFSKVEKLRRYLYGDIGPLGEEREDEVSCASGFCCTKCGKDLAMTHEKFEEIFPKVTSNKQEYIDAFNVSMQEAGFEYNTCERQAKIIAQIAIETNHLTATKEGQGKTWKLTGENQLLDYFKATAKAKVRWFNQEFWSTLLYKQFSQVSYYEKIADNETILKSDRYKPTDTVNCYGTYKGVIQPQYLVKIPTLFIRDTLGQFKKYNTPTLTERAQMEKNIFNYAYGNNMGNGDYLTTDDGYNYRGKGAIQLTGKDAYISLNIKLKVPPFNVETDIVVNPDAIADEPKLVIYSAFIHFKSQLKNDIKKLDDLAIEKVSALVNTGDENKVANHSDLRTIKYNTLIGTQYECKKDE